MLILGLKIRSDMVDHKNCFEYVSMCVETEFKGFYGTQIGAITLKSTTSYLIIIYSDVGCRSSLPLSKRLKLGTTLKEGST
jgi:hypothetical protein